MDVGLVCDACSALTPIGVPQCTRCGAAVALDPRPRRSASKPPPTGAPVDVVDCSKCGVQVAGGTRFCPNCGTRIVVPQNFDVPTRVQPRPSGQMNVQRPATKSGRSTLYFGGAMQAARAKLTLIRGDGEDGVSFTLAGQEHFAGRGECPISFPDDPFLSPVHANFVYADGKLLVRDVDSLNGVFVRISGNAELVTGATVLLGEQVLTISPAKIPDDSPDNDGTYYSASIVRPATLEIRQNLRGGQIGSVYRIDGDVVTLGREGNDINFPEDPFISGHHAELRLTNGVLSVTDLGSRNGTFVRVNRERVLNHGDYVFLGQQLLRVEIV
ncbi:MAG: FHA domain-containing protein [Kofleriaceae bacterium]